MQKLLKKILSNPSYLYVIIFIIGSLMTMFSLIPSYSVDGYCQLRDTYMDYAKTFISGGRLFTGSLWAIFHYINLPRDILSICSVILSNAFLTLSVVMLISKLQNKKFNTLENLLLIVGTFLLVYNPFVMEFFVYEESFAMCLSLLLVIKSAIMADQRIKKSYILSFLVLLCAGCFYQGSLCLYIPLIFLLRLFKDYNLKFKEFFKKNIIHFILSGICYGLTLISLFILIKIIMNVFNLTSTKMGTLNILYNIKHIGLLMKIVLRWDYNYINPMVFNLFIIIMVIFNLIGIFKSSQDKFKKTAYVILMVLICFAFTFIPNLAMKKEANYTAARLASSFGGIIGFLSLLSVLNKGDNKKILVSILFVSLLFFGYNFYNYSQNTYSGFRRYKNDLKLIEQIDKDINMYEKKQNTHVKKLKIKRLMTYNPYYFKNIGDEYSYKLTASNWAFECGLSGITSKNYIVEDMSEKEYLDNFKEITKFDKQKTYELFCKNKICYIVVA